jgi:hypothetical protein
MSDGETSSVAGLDVSATVMPQAIRVRTWPRLLLVEVLQALPIALLFVGSAAAMWTAALIGSAICCYGTDSLWRWRNRLLVAQAIVWLVIPVYF